MEKAHVLVVSQVIQQWYLDVLQGGLQDLGDMDLISGSDIHSEGITLIASPKHDARGLMSRFHCWWKHYRFLHKWLKKNKKHYDLVIMTSNPPINSMLAIKIRKKLKVPVIYMNWDLYPQVIEAQMKNPMAKLVCRIWNLLNNRNYPKIDCMLTIADHLATAINQPLKKKITVDVLPVVTDTHRMKPVLKSENPFCMAQHLEDKLVVLYSGKMGYGHNIEIMLEAAKCLEEREDIVFLFIGEGPKKALVEKFILENRSGNVLLFPLQSYEMFPYSMAAGDIALISQEQKMAGLFMPSKTYDCMAVGQAIIGICSGNDDLSDLIRQYRVGEVVTDSRGETLANVVRTIADDPLLRTTYQENARRCAEENFSLEVSQASYRKLFEKILASQKK